MSGTVKGGVVRSLQGSGTGGGGSSVAAVFGEYTVAANVVDSIQEQGSFTPVTEIGTSEDSSLGVPAIRLSEAGIYLIEARVRIRLDTTNAQANFKVQVIRDDAAVSYVDASYIYGQNGNSEYTSIVDVNLVAQAVIPAGEIGLCRFIMFNNAAAPATDSWQVDGAGNNKYIVTKIAEPVT